ncbi:MAG: ankyrin repeat domain-containing protein [Treponema sp.]|nr:ankyrin repeat domain-containing protein [Treponema sp.]
MKSIPKHSFFKLSSLLLAFLFVALSCKGTPKTAGTEKINDDVWSLLAKGDEKAKNFFIGEVDVSAADSKGWTVLHYAANLDDPGLAAFFIARGADVNAEDNAKQTPLGIAAEKDAAQAAKIIVNNGANIHAIANNGKSPAMIAIGKNDFLKAILTPASIVSTTQDEKTILHLAAEAGNVTAVKTILAAMDAGNETGLGEAQKKSNVLNKNDAKGNNPLDIAFLHTDSRDCMEIAEQLILAGAVSNHPAYYYFSPAVKNANYDLKRADGLSSLHFACANGYNGLITFLLEKKADVNLKNSSGSTPLHEAVRSGRLDTVAIIINAGGEINAQDAKGNSVLHIAVPPQNQPQMINLLLRNSANPNLRDEHGDSPLHVLVTLNRGPEAMHALLEGGADASIRNVYGQTPLYLAVQKSRLPLIPLLLAAGSDIFAADNSRITPFDLALQQNGAVFDALITDGTVRQTDSAGNNVLHIALQKKSDINVIAKILIRDIKINSRNHAGDTPLHFAARMNQKEAGEFILVKGGDIFSSNSVDESPLYIALTHRQGILQWMFNEKTIVMHDGLGNSMLHYAALWKLDRQIPFLIQKGISPDIQNAAGETPLFWAVKYDGISTLNVLVKEKANLHIRDSFGNSVLHSAVKWNAVNSTKALMNAGIDPNVYNFNGTTPLHDSVRLGLTGIAVILLDKGANIEVRDSGGNTPFMESVKAGQSETVRLLAGKGADPKTRNAVGDTPLHHAVIIENIDIINFLLSKGASIHARNTRNKTPFLLALNDSPGMATVLLTKEQVNSPDDFGYSPLHLALQEKVSLSLLKAIIDRGARLSAVDSNGRIPLRLAADMNNWEAVKILADAGSDPFLAASDEKTSCEIAIVLGSDAIKAVFSGRAINARDQYGNTALHYAARMGKPQTITLLLELGADRSAKNISTESPADIAKRWNKNDNAALLN